MEYEGMFLENKYKTWYFEIVISRQKLERSKKLGIFEKHHVIPRSLDGTNEKNNLVLLTPREHFLCHWLLVKMTEGKAKRSMVWALHRLTFSKADDRVYSGRQYETARRLHRQNLIDHHPLKNDPALRHRLSIIVTEHWKDNDERRKKAAERVRRRYEQNTEAANAHLRAISQSGANAAKQTLKNTKRPHLARFGLNNHMFGKHSPGAQKMKARAKCIHCEKESTIGNIARWHNSNCKMKGESVR